MDEEYLTPFEIEWHNRNINELKFLIEGYMRFRKGKESVTEKT